MWSTSDVTALTQKKSVKLPGDTMLPVRIALAQQNLDKAQEYLMDVSHPESPNYGKHWSAKQVAETFAPTEDAVTAVMGWLEDAGIERQRIKQSQGLNWVHTDLTVDEAENLLQTKYYGYRHTSSGQGHVACDEYSVPENIREHIDFITPTVHFDAVVGMPKKRRSMKPSNTPKLDTSVHGHPVSPSIAKEIGKPGSGSLPKTNGQKPSEIITELENCDVSIVPICLEALYEFPVGVLYNPKNSYAVVEYTPQAYLPSDLDMFFANYYKQLIGQRPKFDSIDGGLLQTEVESFDYNGESDLDIEYAMSLIYPQQLTLYQVGDLVENASFNTFLDAIDASYCTYDGGDDPTQDPVYPDPYAAAGYGVYKGPENCGGYAATKVISTSYAYNEADLTPFYEMRQCNEYMKLGLQGTTFLYASGDNGVAGNGGECIDPVTGAYNNGTSGMFNPSFPGTCPYITAVGATQVKPGATVTQPEEAAESVIYSGGGFSNVFEVPSYQASAVATYFAEHKPPYSSAQYNTSEHSRGFPDISANGVNYVFAIDGEFEYVFGTSASSPVVGSILTLVNAARLNAGKSSIGFVNPVLYAHPGVLNDITSGGNQGCGTPGFTAVKGWDPVTGLGTPNFPKMVALWLSLP